MALEDMIAAKYKFVIKRQQSIDELRAQSSLSGSQRAIFDNLQGDIARCALDSLGKDVLAHFNLWFSSTVAPRLPSGYSVGSAGGVTYSPRGFCISLGAVSVPEGSDPQQIFSLGPVRDTLCAYKRAYSWVAEISLPSSL